MDNIEQNIKIALDKKFTDFLSPSRATILANKMKTLIPKLIIARTQAGFDIHGRKFGGYNASYDKATAYKYAAKKHGLTSYASSSKSNKLQLTGNLFSSIIAKTKSVKVVNGRIQIIVNVGIQGREEQEKAIGLQSTTGYTRGGGSYSKKSWEFFGLSVSGSYRQNEKTEVLKEVSKVLGKQGGLTLNIL